MTYFLTGHTMNTFNWLLMGHLLGDWVLQNDWMARGKKKGVLTLAGAVHFAIYTATIIGALWFSGVADQALPFYLIVGGAIFVSHGLIDATSGVEWWMRLYRQTPLEIVRIAVDQTLHLLALAALSAFVAGL